MAKKYKVKKDKEDTFIVYTRCVETEESINVNEIVAKKAAMQAQINACQATIDDYTKQIAEFDVILNDEEVKKLIA